MAIGRVVTGIGSGIGIGIVTGIVTGIGIEPRPHIERGTDGARC